MARLRSDTRHPRHAGLHTPEYARTRAYGFLICTLIACQLMHIRRYDIIEINLPLNRCRLSDHASEIQAKFISHRRRKNRQSFDRNYDRNTMKKLSTSAGYKLISLECNGMFTFCNSGISSARERTYNDRLFLVAI